MAGINHSTALCTVQRSTTRTSIFHPHTINIPCCCFCCFPRAIFSPVLRPLCFPACFLSWILYTFAAPRREFECICLAFCQFSKHFSFAFYVQFFQFSHRKCFDKYAQLEFWSGRESKRDKDRVRVREREQVLFAQFDCTKLVCQYAIWVQTVGEIVWDILSNEHINKQKCTILISQNIHHSSLSVSLSLSVSVSLSLQFNQFDCYGSQVR